MTTTRQSGRRFCFWALMTLGLGIMAILTSVTYGCGHQLVDISGGLFTLSAFVASYYYGKGRGETAVIDALASSCERIIRSPRRQDLPSATVLPKGTL